MMMFRSARQDFSRKLKWIYSILAAKNDQAVNAFGGPSRVRPPSATTHNFALRHGSRNDLTPCRMVLHFDCASASATTSSKRPTATATRRGREGA